jgi:glycosyltransferase involved in cell wall biosynthesis
MNNDSADMPIVLVQPHLKFGGAERQTVLLANAFVESGRSCTVLLNSLSGGLLPSLDPRVITMELGISNHALVPFSATLLKRALKKLPPSHVIVRLWSSIMTAALVDKSLPQHKFVYYEDLDPTDHAEYISFGNTKQRIIRRVFSRDRRLVANTDHVATSMQTTYRLDHIPLVVPCGIDIASISRDIATLPRSGNPSVVTVGSLIERKGLRAIREALGHLPYRVTWNVIGEGPLGDWLKASVSGDTNIDLVLHGGIPEPYEIVANSDLTVHGATSESFGIVLLESLAVGTPVLAVGANGPKEIVRRLGAKDDVLGLVAAGNAQVIAASIESMLGNARPSAQEMRAYIAPYDFPAIFRQWEEVLGVDQNE